MKIHITDIITRPEPSVSPVAALYIALLAAGCLTAVTALLLSRI